LEIELLRTNLLLQLLRLLFVELLLRPLDEGHYVAHPEDTLSHPARIERRERIQLLTHRCKLDGLMHNVADGERRPAPRIAIELRKHDAIKVEPPVELLRGVHGILPCHAIDDEEDLMRMYRLLDLLHL